jgi:UDPglucose--hexose-1-phosphate uridylyltransferase
VFDQKCPFCPGNEVNTPGETFRISDDGKWKVRVVPNKFAALKPEGESIRKIDGTKHTINGVGIHDVVIETPAHNLTTAFLSIDEIKDVIASYKARYEQILQDNRIEMVIIFKNHGEAAGTSLIHPHSQIVGTPVVPSQIRYRMHIAMEYFDDTGECVYCKIMNDELKAKERIVLETEYFVAFVPYASLSPFHTWIFPKRHTSSFRLITENEIKDLSYQLKTILGKLYHGLNNPDFNYCIRSNPKAEGEVEYYHWYLTIVPRLTRTAGFELGSGMYINVSLPEENAEFLRTVNQPEAGQP